MAWNVTDIPTTYETDYKGTGEPRLFVNPADLYPAMIAHIRNVLSAINGEGIEAHFNAYDADGNAERVIVPIQRGVPIQIEAFNAIGEPVTLNAYNALAYSGLPVLPEIAAVDSDFTGAKRLMSWAYTLPDSAWQDALTPRSEFEDGDPRLELRAQALDCALGWFNRALRMECRRNSVPVPHRTINRDDDYRL